MGANRSLLRHGLLPSFTGTDICYSPAKTPGVKVFNLPSTQWLVGLADGSVIGQRGQLHLPGAKLRRSRSD
jgi:hypothetical protein